MLKRRVCGVGACTCICDPRRPQGTSWAGIDRIPPARRLVGVGLAPRIKKIFFVPCYVPFGPEANSKRYSQLHVRVCLLVSYMLLAPGPANLTCFSRAV